MITIEDFQKVEIRLGKIIRVEDFPEAKKPVYQLEIDFGSEIGTKKSAAGLTHYSKDFLLGKQVLAVTNLAPRQVGSFLSEVLTLGVPDKDGKTILVTPEKEADLLGVKLY